MESADELRETLAPAQLLTQQQRTTLLEYARLGSVRATGSLLGISPQTVKNHLADAYRRLGVRSGPQAVFVMMGGEGAVSAIPPAAHDLAVLRARVRALERQARGRSPTPLADRLPSRRDAVPLDVPVMVDGHITLAQLRAASRRYDADMARTADMQMACGEWVDLLSYHIRPSDPALASEASA